MKFLQVYHNLKETVTELYHTLNLKLTKAVGRSLAINPIESITLALYWKKQNIQTKKAMYDDFAPKCTYKTFVESINRFALHVLVILHALLAANKDNAHPVKFIDSTDVPVCLAKNASRHRTMKALADWGRGSKGLYYGLKLHIVTDWHRRTLSVAFSPAHTDDRTPVPALTKDMDGIFVADAGYVSQKLADTFHTDKRILLAKPRKNMKKLMSSIQSFLYDRRMSIEWNIKDIKCFHGLLTSLPRSINGYLGNYAYALLSYLVA